MRVVHSTLLQSMCLLPPYTPAYTYSYVYSHTLHTNIHQTNQASVDGWTMFAYVSRNSGVLMGNGSVRCVSVLQCVAVCCSVLQCVAV